MKQSGEYLLIGGVKQWVSYDANMAGKPLILFLHGGPGLVIAPLLWHFCAPIFENYLVVHWDQRGSGRSYSAQHRGPLTVSGLVADGLELSALLCQKFQKEKIILIGHSWGSALGILMCSKAPGYFHQYIGIGQVGDWLKGERASYDFVLGKARLCGDRALAKRLERNGPPPYKKTARLMAQRGALLRCGGSLYGKTSYRHLQPYYVGAQGYSLPDAARAALGLRDSLKALWGECQALKLNDIAGRLEVPVHIIAGRHDMQVPAAVAKEYFDGLAAPQKSWHWFEQSAHAPMIEEPEKFNSLMLSVILPVF